MNRTAGHAKRAPRIDVQRPAVLVDSEGRETGVLILDVSSGGFRLQVEEDLRIGEFVTLRVERGQEFPAQIRWALGNEAGGVFLANVDYSKLA
jgi:PilZ domain